MGEGIKAWWLTLASGSIIALLSMFGARWVGTLSRRTEIDKMYMQRVTDLERQRDDRQRECDELRAVVQELREQHLADLPCLERERQLMKRVEELMTRMIGVGEMPRQSWEE